jgi:hypothetical protein
MARTDKARRRGAPRGPASAPAAAAPDSTPPSASGTRKHVRNLTLITVVAAAPYASWLGYLWLHLQSGLLRAPVADNGTRQLLVVGMQSAGTNDMARQFQAMGLEMAHESSDATWEFARDGTVSWLHFLRIMPGRASQATLDGLCGAWRANMGFHPAMFRVPRRGCSYRRQWDACWRAECTDLVSVGRCVH